MMLRCNQAYEPHRLCFRTVKIMASRLTVFLLLSLLAVSACDRADNTAVPEENTAGAVSDVDREAVLRSPGKPLAPISIQYKVLGSAVVGQPVAVEVQVSSSLLDRPIEVSYFVNDADSMSFPESQPTRVELRVPGSKGTAARQVTVVPQREGRLYLNVTAEIETDAGRMLKSMAIPIAVGPGATVPEVNGELRETAEGETVLSMPAVEN